MPLTFSLLRNERMSAFYAFNADADVRNVQLLDCFCIADILTAHSLRALSYYVSALICAEK